MLKSTIGPSLVVYSPPKKISGRMIYKIGTNLEHALHSAIVNCNSKVIKLKNVNKQLKKKNEELKSTQDSSSFKLSCLNESLKILKGHVKSYVTESIKSNSCEIPDIHSFDLHLDINWITVFWLKTGT